MRYDGRDGRGLKRDGIFRYAYDCIADRGVSVPGGVDLYRIPAVSESGMPLYFLPHQLGPDLSRTFDLLCRRL